VVRAHGRAFACWLLNRTGSHGNAYAASAPTLQCAPSESTNCASTPPKSCFLGGMLNSTPLAIQAYTPLANLKLDVITTERIADFASHRQAQGIKVTTVNASLRILRRVLRVAEEWG
jgi:hypothetical protein